MKNKTQQQQSVIKFRIKDYYSEGRYWNVLLKENWRYLFLCMEEMLKECYPKDEEDED